MSEFCKVSSGNVSDFRMDNGAKNADFDACEQQKRGPSYAS